MRICQITAAKITEAVLRLHEERAEQGVDVVVIAAEYNREQDAQIEQLLLDSGYGVRGKELAVLQARESTEWPAEPMKPERAPEPWRRKAFNRSTRSRK